MLKKIVRVFIPGHWTIKSFQQSHVTGVLLDSSHRIHKEGAALHVGYTSILNYQFRTRECNRFRICYVCLGEIRAKFWRQVKSTLCQFLNYSPFTTIFARSWTTHSLLSSCKILNYSPFTTILQDPELLTLHYHLARSGTTHPSLPPCKILDYSPFTTTV